MIQPVETHLQANRTMSATHTADAGRDVGGFTFP